MCLGFFFFPFFFFFIIFIIFIFGFKIVVLRCLRCLRCVVCVNIFTLLTCSSFFYSSRVMDNVEVPILQSFFKTHLGFPIPFVPMGDYGLPVHRSMPITVVVGNAIYLPQIPNPSKQEVDAVARLYFDRLHAMFERYKGRAGFGDMNMLIVDA